MRSWTIKVTMPDYVRYAYVNAMTGSQAKALAKMQASPLECAHAIFTVE